MKTSAIKWFSLGATAALLIGGLLLWIVPASRTEQAPAQPGALTNSAGVAPLPLPAVQVAPLSRAELLAIVAAAADRAAGGRPQADAGDPIGRSFLIRLPIGCGAGQAGGGAATDWARWSYNRQSATLKLEARPERWAEAPWIAEIADGMDYEAVEGFWVRRPWTTSETCPTPAQPAPTDIADGAASVPAPGAAPDADEPSAAVAQTFGIAQFFSPQSRRALRRGARPYTATLKVEDPATVGSYRLVLRGRITGYPDGQAVRCRTNGHSLPPMCIISVEFTQVGFENARTGEALTQWQN